MELCDLSLFDLLHRDRAELSTYERLQVRRDRNKPCGHNKCSQILGQRQQNHRKKLPAF